MEFPELRNPGSLRCRDPWPCSRVGWNREAAKFSYVPIKWGKFEMGWTSMGIKVRTSRL